VAVGDGVWVGVEVGEGVTVDVDVGNGVTVSSGAKGVKASVAVEESGGTSNRAVGIAAGAGVVRPAHAAANNTSSVTLTKPIETFRIQDFIAYPFTTGYRRSSGSLIIPPFCRPV